MTIFELSSQAVRKIKTHQDLQSGIFENNSLQVIWAKQEEIRYFASVITQLEDLALNCSNNFNA